MNKIWMLSLSNIRKSKGAFVSLSLIIFVAVILLNLGILTSLNFSKSFDSKAADTHSAHVEAAMLKQDYQDRQEVYLTDYPGVTETEKEEVIFLWPAKFAYGTGEFTNPCILMEAETKRNISTLSFVGKQEPNGDRDIYVSYILHTGGGYDLGDEFVINYLEKDYVFRIAGFTQDIHLGSVNMGCIGFYLPGDSYLRFQKELNDETTAGILLKVRIADKKASQELITDFKKNEKSLVQSDTASPMWLSSYTNSKNVRTMTADIGGAIITCFSLIILLVSLLIIKFRVNTSIEDGMTDIGALKAIGYTSRQIISSILLQFIIIAGLSTILGIIVSYLAVGTLSNMFSAQTGIVWEQGFDLKSSLISCTIIFSSVLIITPLAAKRINKIPPIIALRSGIVTHSFKKNHCPLDEMKGSLNFVLAIKNMVNNFKQNIMISIIIAAISFACVFAIVMYYNIVAHNEAFLNMTGTEMSSVIAATLQGEDAVLLREDISKLPGVRKSVNYDYTSATINEEDSQVMIVGDFLLLDNNRVYEGRFPEYENEVVISGYMAEHFNKKVGDILQVTMGDKTEDYLITGLIQSSSSIGMNLSMTFDGVIRLQPDYKFSNINIYLEEEEDVDLFINSLNQKFGNRLAGTLNMKELTKSQLGIYMYIVSIFSIVILIVTALIVIMILYLIIKALIIRRRKEFGIQKALGFTTYQLMTQISFSFLPIVLFGAIIGSIAGSFSMNSITSVLFSGIGVKKVDFTIPSLWIVIMSIGICLLAYSVSMLVSWRIRKITAYALIVE